MRLYILDLGFLELDSSIIVKGGIGRAKVPVWAGLLRCDNGKNVLFDTGCGNDKGQLGTMKLIQSERQTLENQCILAGVSLSDIDEVIVSHPHYDHIANIFLFRGKDIYLPYMGENYSDFGVSDSMVKELGIRFIDEGFSLCDDVKVYSFPGHTKNLLGLFVSLNCGSFLLCSDAMYTPESEKTYPSSSFDEKAYARSIEKIKEICSKEKAQILYPHSFSQFEKLKKAPQFYE